MMLNYLQVANQSDWLKHQDDTEWVYTNLINSVFFLLNLYVLCSRLHHSSIPLVPHILFGDFNFRLDNKRVVEVNNYYEMFVLFVTGNTALKHLSLCIVFSSNLSGMSSAAICWWHIPVPKSNTSLIKITKWSYVLSFLTISYRS